MNNYIEQVDKKLDEYLKTEFPEEIFNSMKYTVTLPGKRLRPVMCLEACRIMGGDINLAFPAACAIEMLHAQSLIHDDLPCMDNDDFRRGKPSNHKVFGEAIAVLAGDALLSFAPQIIIEKSELPADTVLKVLHEFVKAAGAYQLIGGQVADIMSENGKLNPDNMSKADLLKYIHTNKANEDKIKEMEDLGQSFGLAFQIYDDIMDEISTFEEMGKTLGKDKESGKLTYVSLFGLDKAKSKVTELISQARLITNKYNSEILNSILDKILEKVTKNYTS